MKLCKYPDTNCNAQYHGKNIEIMCCINKCEKENPFPKDRTQKDIIFDMVKIAREVLEKNNPKIKIYYGESSADIDEVKHEEYSAEDNFAFDDSILSGLVSQTDWKEHSQKLFEVTLMQHKEITELKERIGKAIVILNNPWAGTRNIMKAIKILKG